MIETEEHGDCWASLTTSDGRELTTRVPCEMSFGRVCDAQFNAPECVVESGIAERLVVWCADCGSMVRCCRLHSLIVLDRRGPAFGVNAFVIPFHEKFMPRGLA